MRIRQVWPREQVAHLWANASQDSARDPSGNMYFNGGVLYSYGSHYVIGVRLVRADGSPLFVMNADTNSPTTNKMRHIAFHALPRFNDVVWVGGLNANRWHNLKPANMAAKALTQAGEAYDSAWRRVRDGAPRRAFLSDASERLGAAEACADYTLQDKSATATDKRAARAVLRLVAKVRALPNDSRADWQARAREIIREEKRAEVAGLVDKARTAYALATDADVHPVSRYDYAADAGKVAAEARATAKAYGLRVPKLPNGAALAAELLPAANASRLETAKQDARDALERAEQSARFITSNAGSASWHAGSVRRYSQQVIDHANAAVSYGGRVAEWMIERAAHLARRIERAGRIDAAAGAVSVGLPRALESADSYAQAGHAKDAGREYARFVRAYVDAVAALSGLQRHPARLQLARLEAEHDRAAAYVADLAAKIEAENAEKIAAWRAGGRCSFAAYDMPPLLRVVDREIQSSQGAIVPVSAAPRLWRLIERVRGGDHDAGRAFEGLHVGPFTLREIRADGSAVIGCHDIPYSELRRAAVALNLEPNA